MSVEPNPYEVGREPSELSEPIPDRDPALLHRGLGALIGSIYGACGVAFLAYFFQTTAIKSGFLNWLDIGGPYPEIGLFILPILALPSGIAGGLICGATRGRRLGIAISASLVIPLLFCFSGTVFGSNFVEAIFISSLLAISTVAGVLECHGLIRLIVRRRRIVTETVKTNPDTSPGLIGATLNVLLTVVLMTFAFSIGKMPEYIAGIMAGAGIVGTLTSLYLLAAYPNRVRIGISTVAGCVITVVFLLLLHVDT